MGAIIKLALKKFQLSEGGWDSMLRKQVYYMNIQKQCAFSTQQKIQKKHINFPAVTKLSSPFSLLMKLLQLNWS